MSDSRLTALTYRIEHGDAVDYDRVAAGRAAMTVARRLGVASVILRSTSKAL